MGKKMTKKEGVNMTVEAISNVLDIIEVATVTEATEATEFKNVETLPEGAILCGNGVMLRTEKVTDITPIQIDMINAINALEASVKALKKRSGNIAVACALYM